MEDPLKNFADFYKKSTDQSEADKQLADDIAKDLLAMLPKVKELFSGFQEASVEHMMSTYAHERMRFTKNADYYATKAEEMLMDFRSNAEERLKLIQYKKLFNLQCRWRAGQIELEGIETTHDFHRWEKDIYHCPFLPPIESEEVDLMVRFLTESPPEAEGEEIEYDWHNYEYLKLCYYDEEELEPDEFYSSYAVAIIFDSGIPPWYDFYDSNMGTTGLLGLPDTKKPKEIFYQRLYGQHLKKEKEKEEKKAGTEPKPVVIPEKKLWLGSDGYTTNEAIEELVKKFETPENKKRYANFVAAELKDDDDDEVIDEEFQSTLYRLEKAREPVPIEANEDYRLAVIIAYRRFRAKKTIGAIPSAFEHYLMCIQTGIGFPIPKDNEVPQYLLDAKNHILEGRKLNGEPPNFDY